MVASGLAVGWVVAAGISGVVSLRAGGDRQGPGPSTEQTSEVEETLRAGKQYLAGKRYEDAFAAYQRVRVLAPGDPRPVHGLGQVEVALKRMSAAEERFREAMVLDPGYIPAVADLAMVLGTMGHAQEAVSLLERARAEKPENISIRMMLGENLLRNNQPEHAVEAFEGCLRLPGADRHAPLWALLGQAHLAAGHDEPARQALEMALQLDPKLPQPHFWLGQLLMRTGNEQEGRRQSAAFREYADLDRQISKLSGVLANRPDDMGLLLALAQANLDRGFPERAAIPLRRALSLAPADPAVRAMATQVEQAMKRASIVRAGN
jgi:Flp pilus assembly protein TadD